MERAKGQVNRVGSRAGSGPEHVFQCFANLYIWQKRERGNERAKERERERECELLSVDKEKESVRADLHAIPLPLTRPK